MNYEVLWTFVAQLYAQTSWWIYRVTVDLTRYDAWWIQRLVRTDSSVVTESLSPYNFQADFVYLASFFIEINKEIIYNTTKCYIEFWSFSEFLSQIYGWKNAWSNDHVD